MPPATATQADVQSPLSFSGLSEPLLRYHRSGYGEAVPYYKVKGTTGSIAVEVANGKLYSLTQSGLHIYDITTPRQPRLIGSVEGFINARQLAVRGSLAYVTSRQCGLWIVDVSDTVHPQILSNFDTVEMATGLDISGSVAFIGARTYGVQAVDVSDPLKPKHISSFLTDESQSVLYRDGVLFSGDWARGEVTILDVSDLNAIKPISFVRLDGYGDGMFIRGNVLFASTGWHRKSGAEGERYATGNGLDIFDISNLKHPVRLSSIKFPRFYMRSSDYWMPRVTGNICIASNTANGLFFLDVSDLENPHIIGNLVLPDRDIENPSVVVSLNVPLRDPAPLHGDPIAAIAVGDGVVYIAGAYTGLYLIDMPSAKPQEPSGVSFPQVPENLNTDPHPDFIASHDASGGAVRSVALVDDIAYAACSSDGLKVFKIAENSIIEITRTSIRYAASVGIKDGHLYCAEGADGLGIYRIVSETELSEIARIKALATDELSFVQYLWAPCDGNYIVASSASSRFYFINVENPTAPKVVSCEEMAGLVYGDYGTHQLVGGRYFALTYCFGGLVVCDLAGSTPRTVFKENFPLCSQTSGLAAWGNQLFAVNMSGYSWVDIDTMTAISDFKRHKFPDCPDADLPPLPQDNSPITQAMIAKTLYDGFPTIDEQRSIVCIANRMFKTCGVYDFSDKEAPKLIKRFFFRNTIHRPAFLNGRMVLPAGYSGLLLERA